MAIDTPVLGTLVHPYYGEITVCINGEVRRSHSGREGRLCRVSFSVVEAGELSFSTAGIATSQTLIYSSSALNDRIEAVFADLGLKGLVDFSKNGVLNQAKSMINHVSNAFDTIDSGITVASRLLHGDISVCSNLAHRVNGLRKPYSEYGDLADILFRMPQHWHSRSRRYLL